MKLLTEWRKDDACFFKTTDELKFYKHVVRTGSVCNCTVFLDHAISLFKQPFSKQVSILRKTNVIEKQREHDRKLKYASKLTEPRNTCNFLAGEWASKANQKDSFQNHASDRLASLNSQWETQKSEFKKKVATANSYKVSSLLINAYIPDLPKMS